MAGNEKSGRFAQTFVRQTSTRFERPSTEVREERIQPSGKPEGLYQRLFQQKPRYAYVPLSQGLLRSSKKLLEKSSIPCADSCTHVLMTSSTVACGEDAGCSRNIRSFCLRISPAGHQGQEDSAYELTRWGGIPNRLLSVTHHGTVAFPPFRD